MSRIFASFINPDEQFIFSHPDKRYVLHKMNYFYYGGAYEVKNNGLIQIKQSIALGYVGIFRVNIVLVFKWLIRRYFKNT